MNLLRILSEFLSPVKKESNRPVFRCFLCGKASRDIPYRYGGKDVCHDCFTDLKEGRKRLPEERAAVSKQEKRIPQFTVEISQRGDPQITVRAARWSSGQLNVTGEVARSAVVEYWNSISPMEQEEETWALFNREEGMILRRFRDRPYDILSSHRFEMNGMITEYTREKNYFACMLERPPETLPDARRGSWEWGGRDIFDDVISVSYDGYWVQGSALCHYHDGGWGGSGPVHESRRCLFPAALFANRRDALESVAKRLEMLPYRPEGILKIMEEGGFLGGRTEKEQP